MLSTRRQEATLVLALGIVDAILCVLLCWASVGDDLAHSVAGLTSSAADDDEEEGADDEERGALKSGTHASGPVPAPKSVGEAEEEDDDDADDDDDDDEDDDDEEDNTAQPLDPLRSALWALAWTGAVAITCAAVAMRAGKSRTDVLVCGGSLELAILLCAACVSRTCGPMIAESYTICCGSSHRRHGRNGGGGADGGEQRPLVGARATSSGGGVGAMAATKGGGKAAPGSVAGAGASSEERASGKEAPSPAPTVTTRNKDADAVPS